MPAPAPPPSLRNLWRFMAFTKPYWGWLVLGVVTGLLRMVLPLYMPYFIKHAIDQVAAKFASGELTAVEAWARVLHSLPLLAAIMAMHVVVTLGRLYFPYRAAANAIRDVRFQLFAHLQRLSLSFHHQRPSGAIISRVISDVYTAQNTFDMLLIQGSQTTMQAIVIAGFLLYRDWQWALVSMATVPLFILTTRALRKPMHTASREVLEATERMSGHLAERLAMIREVQSSTAEAQERGRMREHAEQLREKVLRQRWFTGLLTASSEITRYVGLVIVVVFGVHRVLDGAATVGDVTAFFLYVGMLLYPVEFLSGLWAELHSAAAAADRVFEFFDTVPDIQSARGAIVLTPRRPPPVRFEQVSFAYPTHPERLVLRGVDLVVEPGWRVVLVGGSGAGKTTVLSLLPRFFDVSAGRILIDGHDVREATIKSLRQSIGIVPQEPVLFAGSIRENIMYSRPTASEAEMLAAARAANVVGFVEDLPGGEGFDAVVGERGVGLSGGQVQRIAIARAFLKDPAILIFDEATSNLDAHSEALVLEAMDRLAAGRTTFVIAHRLSVARGADLVVVLEHGQVVERGRHEELLDRRGAYFELWQRQVGDVRD